MKRYNDMEDRSLIKAVIREAYLEHGRLDFWATMFSDMMEIEHVLHHMMTLVQGGYLEGRCNLKFEDGSEPLLDQEFKTKEGFQGIMSTSSIIHGDGFNIQLTFSVTKEWGDALREDERRARERDAN